MDFLRSPVLVVMCMSLTAAVCEGSFVNVTVNDWTVPICSSTSLCILDSGCKSPNPSGGRTCQCDPECLFFGDCCADYFEECASSVTQYGPFLAAIEGITSDQLSCMVPTHSPTSGNDTAYLLVDKCDTTWRNGRTRDLCEGPTQLDDIFSFTPVSIDDNLSFKNVYCAICSRKNLAELSAWSFQAECDAQSSNVSSNVSSNETNSQRVDILMSTCSKWYFVPPYSVSGATRMCNKSLLNECENQGMTEAPGTIETVCNSFVAEIVFIGNNGSYRNPLCLLCGSFRENFSVSLFNDISCHSSDITEEGPIAGGLVPETNGGLVPVTNGGLVPVPNGGLVPVPNGELIPVTNGGGSVPSSVGGSIGYRPGGVNGQTSAEVEPAPPPISVLFDFSSFNDDDVYDHGTETRTISCNETEVFDRFLSKCTSLSCPDGYELLNRSCVSLNKHYDSCLEDSFVSTLIKVECAQNVQGMYECAPSWRIANQVLSWLLESITTIRDALVLDTSVKWQNMSSEYATLSGSCDQFTTVAANLSKNFRSLRTSLDNISTEVFGNVGNLTCQVSGVDISLGCLLQNEYLCPNATVFYDGIEMVSDGIETMFYSEETNQSYSIDHTLYNLQLRFNKTSNTSEFSEELSTCLLPYHLACPMVELNASLFVFENESIVYLPLDKTLGPDEYIVTSKDTIKVCSFFGAVGNITDNFAHYFIAFSFGQSVTSFVGCLLSIIALVFSLITYIMFESLRKSICSQLIMSVCVSLILAQLMLLLSGVARTNSKACVFVAVTGHYLWLVVFSHSVALALDLFRRFGLSQTIRKTSEGLRTLLKFVVFAWVFPLAIVLPCLVASLSGSRRVSLSYGTGKSCWIGNGYANLYAFGLPVALALVVNGILFALIVAGLWKRKDPTKKGKKDRVLTDLLIYLKMSTLLGFTWIFGFVAAFADVTALWYVFIILNSLQGVYIFFAFVFNKRVFKLWRGAIPGAPRVSLPLKWSRSKSSSHDGGKSSKKRDQFSSTTSNTTTTTTSKSESTVESVSEAISMTESSTFMQELKKKMNGSTHDTSSSTTTAPTSVNNGTSEGNMAGQTRNFMQELKEKLNASTHV